MSRNEIILALFPAAFIFQPSVSVFTFLARTSRIFKFLGNIVCSYHHLWFFRLHASPLSSATCASPFLHMKSFISPFFPWKFSVWVFWWFRFLLLFGLAFCLFAFFSTNFIARPSKYFPALLHVRKIVWCNSVLLRQRLVWNCMGLIKVRNMYFLGIRAFLKRTNYALNGHKIKLVINLTKRAPLPNS